MSQLRDAAIEVMAPAADNVEPHFVRRGTDTWEVCMHDPARPGVVAPIVVATFGSYEEANGHARRLTSRARVAAALDALLALLRDRPELVEVMARGIHTGRIAEHEGGWDDLDEWGRGCCRKDTVSALATLRDAFGEGE